MKIKILIYGAGYFAQKFMTECLDNEKAEVLAFIESVKSKTIFLNYDVITAKEINDYVYDLLIVISGYIEEIKRTLESYNIDRNKCVFTSDIHNWICNKTSYRKLMKILNNRYIKNEFKLIIENRKSSSFSVAETYDGLSFVGNYADDLLGIMIDSGKVYSYDEIDAFLELANRFYNLNEEGYFFDCGCNILTTAVYVLKQKNSLKAVAFEPVNRTWRIAKANAALNDMDKRITVINRALSDNKGVAQMRCRYCCCAGNYIVNAGGYETKNQLEYEEVYTVTLDDWIEENNFDINLINYLWIDTEGYEGYVISGMMKLLRKRKIPIYMEYYTEFLLRSGCRDLLIDCLEELYSKYIVVKRGGIYDISELHHVKELRNIEEMSENIFLIP